MYHERTFRLVEYTLHPAALVLQTGYPGGPAMR